MNQLKQCNSLYVGFSGGLDSTVLLYALISEPSLASKITAIYIDHGLSHNASQWQAHCEKICHQFGVAFKAHRVYVKQNANIEDQARQARYNVFHALIKANDVLILGHHQDDQAETVLLQLFRGAGIEGLSAMVDWRSFSQGYVARPLLAHSRSILEDYAKQQKLIWIEDESNLDCSYTRNFLRQQVIPLIQTRWLSLNTNLARTAHHCQQAQSNLYDLACTDYPNLNEIKNKLALEPLKKLNLARKQNVLRAWLKKNITYLPDTKVFNRLIHEVLEASEDKIPELSWKDTCIYRYKNTLYLVKKQTSKNTSSIRWPNFPEPLKLPYSLGFLKAIATSAGLVIPENAHVEIRFRQGGEKFYWHRQTKNLKKLLQEWCIPPWVRDQIPLMYINQQLAAVADYAISDNFYQSSTNSCYQLQWDY
ncbi:tRNA lysidine(34) synthetase TilS [Legionella sp. D16C41]|uniref:tRNA lysidine(34) synthetase TilS n=1 Tax=Legionella sp. D16C41 TaxID=3402688 RepID=UPI003AF9D96F